MIVEIMALIPDMFFATKVESTARHVNVDVSIHSSGTRLLQEASQNSPRLVLIDLNSDPTSSLDLIKSLKSPEVPSPPRVIAFLSHVQVELAEAARKAGADLVLPRSAFSRQLPEILKGENPECGVTPDS